MPSDGVVLAGVQAHINQRKTGSLAVGFNRNDMLVALGSYLQLHRVSAVVISTGDGLGDFILAGLGIYVAPGAMALDGLAIFLQVFVVVGDDFFGRVVGDELRQIGRASCRERV